jgi:hypothetical protein
MCATRLEASRSWAQACLDHAELAERRGDSIIGESVARSMQVSALKGLGDQEKLAAVTARQEQARISRGEGSADDGELMLSSPGLFAEYLDVLSQKGESAALDWRRAAAARLRAELPPCRD